MNWSELLLLAYGPSVLSPMELKPSPWKTMFGMPQVTDGPPEKPAIPSELMTSVLNARNVPIELKKRL